MTQPSEAFHEDKDSTTPNQPEASPDTVVRDARTRQQQIDDLLSLPKTIDLTSEQKTQVDKLLSPFEQGSPEENNAFLTGRLDSPARLFRNNDLLDDVATALTSDDQTLMPVVIATIDLTRRESPVKENPVNNVLSAATSSRALGSVKLAEVLKSPFTDEQYSRYNDVFNSTLEHRANDIPLADLAVTAEVAAQLTKKASKAADASGNPDNPQASIERRNQLTNDAFVIESFAELVRARHAANEYVKHLPGEDEAPVDLEQVQRESEFASGLFEDIRSNSRYGLKMGYFVDERGGSIVFNPPLEYEEDALPASSHNAEAARSKSVAHITHSRRKHPRDVRAEHITTVEGSATTGVRVSHKFDTSNLDPLVEMHLGPDGELYSDPACESSLLAMAVESGKYTAYRNLQGTVLSEYFDLTHPYEEVMRIKQEQGELGPREPKPLPDTPLTTIEQMVVPRAAHRRAVENGEIKETPEEESLRIVRMREHDVALHVRRLPEGCHTPPHAYEKAAAAGITLKPGETIVKAHTRGSAALGRVAGHEFVPRPSEQ